MDLTLDSRDELQAKEDGPDGFTASTIFKSAAGCQGLTYDDVILMPGERSTAQLLLVTTVFTIGRGRWWNFLFSINTPDTIYEY